MNSPVTRSTPPSPHGWMGTGSRLLEQLQGILVVLNSDRPLQSILGYLVAEARVLLGSQACVLYRYAPDLEAVLIEAKAGLPEGFPTVSELPLTSGGKLGHAALDAMVLNEAPIACEDIIECGIAVAIQDSEVAAPTRGWFRALAGSYRSLLSVPLVVKETYYGSFGFYYASPRSLSDEELSLAVTFGSQAALAIENARLRQQAEHTAVLQERSRLARDLHDSVTQSLYSLTLLAEAARRLAGTGDLPQVQRAITRLGEIGQQALKEMRLLVYELRPLVLRREGLVRALGQRLETVERRAGVDAHLLVDSPLSLAPVLEEQLYHLIQEALNNALKHASATAVTVSIEQRGADLRVEVRDNGRGFDTNAPSEGGIGLASMAERVEELGGRLSIASAVGEGTSIQVTLDQTPGRPARHG